MATIEISDSNTTVELSRPPATTTTEALPMHGRNVLIVAPSVFLRDLVMLVLQTSKFVASAEDAGTRGSLGDGIDVAPDLVVGIGINAADIDTVTGQIRAVRARFQDVKSAVITNQLASSEVLKALVAGVDAILSMDASLISIQGSLELVLMGHRIFPALPTHLLGFRADSEPATSDSFVHEIRDMPAVVLEQTEGDLVPLSAGSDNAPSEANQLSSPPLTEQGPGRNSLNTLVLSDREEEILRCLVAGLPNKLIARELGLAETTVKVHVKSVLRKLRAQNRTQAAMWAVTRRSSLLNTQNREK